MTGMEPTRPSAAICESDVIAIATTFASRESAEACGRMLVDSRVAACVQIDGPLTSIYRWRDAVEAATEWRCTCKTSTARGADCIAAIRRLHEYQTPQLTVTSLGCTPDYAAWVRQSVSAS